MVPLNAAEILEAKLTALQAIVSSSLPLASETSIGFAQTVLLDRGSLFAAAPGSGDLDYGGIPALAHTGYLAARGLGFDGASFIRAVDRLRGRARAGRDQLGPDDLALLGIATGIAATADIDSHSGARRKWLLDIANENAAPNAWSNRARQLAADLLDGTGRLRSDPQGSADAMAIDLVLRQCWPVAFSTVPPITAGQRQKLIAALLTSANPAHGELERAAIWLAALDLLVKRMSVELVPDYSSLVAMLEATQSAFRRWVWDAKPNRKDIAPARWLIDSEAHVQAFLWAVLEPRFGEHLVDEQYLPGFGQKQPRFDFGLRCFKTIIEVKLIRSPSDFARIEEEVAGDIGLYFSDARNWDRMVVYIYDDSNMPQAERYDTLRSALLGRDQRIRDIVFVQRPSMIPPRNQRGPWRSENTVAGIKAG